MELYSKEGRRKKILARFATIFDERGGRGGGAGGHPARKYFFANNFIKNKKRCVSKLEMLKNAFLMIPLRVSAVSKNIITEIKLCKECFRMSAGYNSILFSLSLSNPPNPGRGAIAWCDAELQIRLSFINYRRRLFDQQTLVVEEAS